MRHSFRILAILSLVALPATGLAAEPAVTFTEPAKLRGVTGSAAALSARATASDASTFRVMWTISRHADLDRPVDVGTVLVKGDNGGRIQLTIERLRPDTEYFVQFRHRGTASETVTLRTAPQKVAAAN